MSARPAPPKAALFIVALLLSVQAADASPAQPGAISEPMEVRQALHDGLKANRESIQLCIDRAAAEQEELEGTWTLTFTVQPDGRTSEVRVQPADPWDRELVACMTQAASAWVFPPFAEPQRVEKGYSVAPPASERAPSPVVFMPAMPPACMVCVIDLTARGGRIQDFTAQLLVQPDGSVSQVALESADTLDEQLASCMTSALMEIGFPPFEGEPTIHAMPFDF